MAHQIQTSPEVKSEHVTYHILEQLHETMEQEVQAMLDSGVMK